MPLSLQSLGFTLDFVINGFGIYLNALLFYLIATKSPESMRIYTVLMYNFAATDFLACIFGIFVAQRMIPCGTALVFTSGGLCRYFNRQTCYVGHCFNLLFYTHTLWSNLISFAYRYFLLFYSYTISRSQLIMTVLVFLVPSILQSSFCSWYALEVDPEPEVLEALVKAKNPNYTFEGDVLYGTTNVFEWRSLQSICYTCAIATPAYVMITVLRARIIKKLGNEAFSESTKRMHSQLLKALTVQAGLPALFIFAVLSYVPSQLGLYSHPFLEQLTFVFLALMPTLSPVINLYFIHSYKKAIVGIIKRKRVEPSIMITTTADDG